MAAFWSIAGWLQSSKSPDYSKSWGINDYRQCWMIVRIGVPLSLTKCMQDTIMQSDLECICVYMQGHTGAGRYSATVLEY